MASTRQQTGLNRFNRAQPQRCVRHKHVVGILLTALALNAGAADKNVAERPLEPLAGAAGPQALSNGVVRIYFKSKEGVAELTDQAAQLLQQVANRLKSNLRASVLLIGHTPDIGSPEYGIALAKKLTGTVASELQKFDLRPGRMREVPAGRDEDARATCGPAPCPSAADNVEIRIVE